MDGHGDGGTCADHGPLVLERDLSYVVWLNPNDGHVTSTACGYDRHKRGGHVHLGEAEREGVRVHVASPLNGVLKIKAQRPAPVERISRELAAELMPSATVKVRIGRGEPGVQSRLRFPTRESPRTS